MDMYIHICIIDACAMNCTQSPTLGSPEINGNIFFLMNICTFIYVLFMHVQ